MKKALLMIVRVLISLLVFADATADTNREQESDKVFLSVPGFEKKIGVVFEAEEVEMVALYRGNNLYLRPLSRKLRLLLGREKAVTTKTLSLPEMVADEAVPGEQRAPSLLISERAFGKPADTFLLNLKGKVISGRFSESRGDQTKMGVVLFMGKKGMHIYQFSVDADGIVAHFSTLTEQQYKSAKKSVEKKLKAAGQKKAAKKVGDL